MISEFFIGIGTALQTWFIGLLGTDDAPTWLTGVAAFITELFARVAGLGAWFPFALLGAISLGLLTWWALFWIVKAIRWLWGLTPFSGGS